MRTTLPPIASEIVYALFVLYSGDANIILIPLAFAVSMSAARSEGDGSFPLFSTEMQFNP